MSSMNHVILMGNLTRDPETRTTPSGTAVCDLGLAISDQYKDRDGKTVENTCFVDIVVWGRQAETSKQYLKKGSPALIEGKLQMDEWKTDSGEKRTKLRIKASRVQFIGRATPPNPDARQPRVEPDEQEVEPVPYYEKPKTQRGRR